jgi:DNA (cytosine-5)-methyltransferase 1
VLKAIELFAGVGGFRLGLEKAGINVEWSNQWEPATKSQAASSCYVSNFGSQGHSNIDIEIAIDRFESGVDPLPKADVIVGGFPCQDYSVAKSANSALGLQGKKGVLWWQIHRLVALVQPKIVLLENVDRLLKSPSTQRGRDFGVMLRTLGDLGYSIEWRVVNAADYGFPQRRIRVFIFASRTSDLAVSQDDEIPTRGIMASCFPADITSSVHSFDLPTEPSEISESFNSGGKSSPFKSAGLYKDGRVTTWDVQARKKAATPLKSVLIEDSLIPPGFFVDKEKYPDWEYLKGAKSIARVSKTGHAYSYSEGKMAFPDSVENPSRTILTGEGGASPSRFKHVIMASSGLRRLTPIELERLNGFPDDWTKFDENGNQISDIKRAFFMGNALVVGLIEILGHEIVKRYSISSDKK